MSAHRRPIAQDLAVLVADKNMQQAIAGLLERPQALGIRPLRYDIFVHVRRDPGCLNEAHDLLRPLAGSYERALVLFDHQGSGREQVTADVLADEVKGRLEQSGWPGRAEAVVIAPELEAWVWSGSPHVATALGWASRQPVLREWLQASGHWPASEPKPPDPKRALEVALRAANKPRSSAIYHDLASQVSLRHHGDPAFLRLTQALQTWFPPPSPIDN